jgi:hypothetical protein
MRPAQTALVIPRNVLTGASVINVDYIASALRSWSENCSRNKTINNIIPELPFSLLLLTGSGHEVKDHLPFYLLLEYSTL